MVNVSRCAVSASEATLILLPEAALILASEAALPLILTTSQLGMDQKVM